MLATLDLRYTNLDSMGVLFVSKPPVKVVPGFPFKVIVVFIPVLHNAPHSERGGGIDSRIDSEIDCPGVNRQGDIGDTGDRRCHLVL